LDSCFLLDQSRDECFYELKLATGFGPSLLQLRRRSIVTVVADSAEQKKVYHSRTPVGQSASTYMDCFVGEMLESVSSCAVHIHRHG
jgi:hypothetical protein